MYCIEMLVENGNWSSSFFVDGQGRRRGSPRPEWVPTGGTWAALGGVFATVEQAEAKAAEYVSCGSRAKPKRFRVVALA